MFKVIFNDNFSVNDLISKQSEGFSVLRTAHIGNQYASNVILSLFFRVLYYDRTTGDDDNIYFPAHLLKAGNKISLTCPTKLTTHATIQNQNEFFDFHNMPVATFHLNAAKEVARLFGKNSINETLFTYSDFLRLHKNIIITLLDNIMIDSRYLAYWKRYVDKDGELYHSHAKSWSDIRNHVLGVTDLVQGWLLPNIFNVFLITMVEYFRTKKNTLFHLGGTNMKYVQNYESDLARMHALIKNANPYIPDIKLIIIHTASNRMVANNQQSYSRINRLITAQQVVDNAKLKKGEYFLELKKQGHCRPDQTVLDSLNALVLNANQALRKKITETLEIFNFPGEQCTECFWNTQHDYSEKPLLHEWAYSVSFNDLSQLLSSWKKLNKK